MTAPPYPRGDGGPDVTRHGDQRRPHWELVTGTDDPLVELRRRRRPPADDSHLLECRRASAAAAFQVSPSDLRSECRERRSLGTLEVGGTTDYAQWIDLAALDDLRGSETMGTILVLGGIAGILSSWNGFLIGASRLIYAMAESGMLPAWFGKLHPKYKTPMNALIFIGGLSVLAPVLRPADAGVVG